MVISALGGRGREKFHSGRFPECYAYTRGILAKFMEDYGGCLCFEVHKKLFGGRCFDLSDPEQFKAFEEAGGHRDKCPAVVGNAAKWVAELIVAGKI